MTEIANESAPEQKKTSIYARFVKAQSEFPLVEKDKTANAFGGGKRGYNFADINSILNVVLPILNRHGLCLMQTLTTEGDRIGISCTLASVDGETIQSPFFFVKTSGLQQSGVQADGSAITYIRRYALVTFLGIAYGVEDDDGRKATLTQVVRNAAEAGQKEFNSVLASLPQSDKVFLMTSGIYTAIRDEFGLTDPNKKEKTHDNQ